MLFGGYMKRILRVWMVFCLLFSAPVGADRTGEIEMYIQNVAQMPVSDLALQKDLVRWYNLNLRSGLQNIDTRKDILSLENGMIGYISIPSTGQEFPICHDDGGDGFYLHPRSAFPSDREGDHIRLVTDMALDLTEGDKFYIFCLDEVHCYRVGGEGRNRCDLICAGVNYQGTYIVED